MSNDGKTISVIFLNALIQYLYKHQVDVDDFLIKHSTSLQVIEDVNTRIPINTYRDLYHDAAEILNEDLLGFNIGKSIKPRFLGVLGFAMITAKNLYEAMNLHLRFNNVIGTYADSEIITGKNHVEIIYRDSNSSYSQIINEKSITSWIAFGRQIIGNEYSPIVINFRFPNNGFKETYQNYFQCKVNFNASESSIVIDKNLLELPNIEYEPLSHNVLKNKVSEDSNKIHAKDAFFKQLDLIVINQLKYGEPNLEDLSKRLKVNQDQIQKKLKNYDLTYSAYLESLRKNLSLRYIKNKNMSMCEIAFSLGFAEQSSFTRAFRRWFGMSPTSYIKNQCQM
ncbi:AraC family transcriptional regulator [Marinicella meishanensis]|uniref:AraC family transcriptional regulator n=1 Tax=Marinicella meishanensis TaxID=2873263 RepID=UPI001CBC4EF6|nr:AraC family transcriptional regulator [Marinicella sp. NBU2979]